MNGTHRMLHRVVEQYGNTVGRRDTDADAFHIRHQRIHALQSLMALFGRKSQQSFIDHRHLRQMHLVGHQQTVVRNPQEFAERFTVFLDSLLLIATIAVDVK